MVSYFQRFQRRKFPGFPCIFVVCFVGLFGFPLTGILPSEPAWAAGAPPIYFFSSEANINNYSSLKKEFDGHLSRYGNYRFQPFKNIETFEGYIRKHPKSLLIISSWHYRKFKDSLQLVPVLVGMRNGSNYQKRLLVAGQKTTGIDLSKLQPIATASSILYTKSVLNQITGKKLDPATRILAVPKDIDALMSLGFGVAKAALVTEHSRADFQKIDPTLNSKLHVIEASKKSLMLIFAVPKNLQKEAKPIVDLFQKMSSQFRGLSMIGLDGWKSFEPSDSKYLEGK